MSEETKPAAPYGPFSTFETALNHIAALKGIPPKIDRSVFPSLGGDAKGHVLNAFKFFGLFVFKSFAFLGFHLLEFFLLISVQGLT